MRERVCNCQRTNEVRTLQLPTKQDHVIVNRKFTANNNIVFLHKRLYFSISPTRSELSPTHRHQSQVPLERASMQRLRLCSTVTHQLLRSVHPPSSSAALCSTIATPNHKGFVAAAPLVTGSGNSTRPFSHFSTCVSPKSSFIATATYDAASSSDSISSRDLRCNPPLCKSEQHSTRSSSQATGARQPMTVLRQPQMHSYAHSQQLRHFSAAAKQSAIHSWSASRTYSASAEGGSAGSNISGGEICWQCKTAVPSGSLFFCPECSVILPANQGANFYSVMGM